MGEAPSPSLSRETDASQQQEVEKAVENVVIIGGGDCGTIFSSIDPVLSAVATKMSGFCAFRPTLQVNLII